MKFVLLVNLKLLTIAKSFLQNIAEHENSSDIVGIFIIIACSAVLSTKKSLQPRSQV